MKEKSDEFKVTDLQKYKKKMERKVVNHNYKAVVRKHIINRKLYTNNIKLLYILRSRGNSGV